MDYYLLNNKLGNYTMNTELKRMDFFVKKGDIQTSDINEILSLYEKSPLLDIWKLANQSIYSQIVTELQSFFLIPELSISIIASSR
jgi:hypothetical protein